MKTRLSFGTYLTLAIVAAVVASATTFELIVLSA